MRLLIGALQVQMAGAVDPIAGSTDESKSIQIQLDEELKKQLSSAGAEAVTEGVMDACELLPGRSLVWTTAVGRHARSATWISDGWSTRYSGRRSE